MELALYSNELMSKIRDRRPNLVTRDLNGDGSNPVCTLRASRR